MRTRIQWRSPVDSDFSDGRGPLGGNGRRHAFGVSAAELVANRSQLALLEFADGNPAPPLGGRDDGGIHQLTDGAPGLIRAADPLLVASLVFARYAGSEPKEPDKVPRGGG